MKKEFKKYGVLDEVSKGRFFGIISEGWDYYDIDICLEDGKKYDIVFSSSKQEYRWME